MNILFLGDIVGKSGRQVITKKLKTIKKELEVDVAIINCENSAAGFGVTHSIVDELFAAGADVLTTGDHIWDKKEVFDFIDMEPYLIRPANYPKSLPGNGYCIYTLDTGKTIAVINLMGQVFMGTMLNSPFETIDAILEEIEGKADYIFVDFHAEATSEKQAMGWYLDGRITAIAGTHTHVPTADHRVLTKGTGYQTDAGMVGCINSVIGMTVETSLKRFVNRIPQRFEVSTSGYAQINGLLVKANDDDHLCHEVVRIQY